MNIINNTIKYTVEAFKKIIDFNGRATRPQFWYFQLGCFIVSVIISILGAVLGSIAETLGSIMGLVSMLWSLATFLPSISVGIRRMHDINMVGWWILVPLYNLYLFCQPTINEGNKYNN